MLFGYIISLWPRPWQFQLVRHLERVVASCSGLRVCTSKHNASEGNCVRQQVYTVRGDASDTNSSLAARIARV